MTNVVECVFKAPNSEDVVPENAIIWSPLQYCDEKGWYSLSNHEEVSLRPTVFDDKRIKFLNQLEAIPTEFDNVLGGKYEAKAWGKDNCYVVIEGEKSVHISLPGFQEKINYNSKERFPTFLKNWKIVVALLNEHVIFIRINKETALLISVNEKKNVTVKAINYDSGFLCVNPFSNLAIAYGNYAYNDYKKCEIVPNLKHAGADFEFFVHLFKWGHIILPKFIDINIPVPGLKLIQKKVDCIALISLPPNIYIYVQLVGPKCIRKVEYGKDYCITAIKSSESDLDIYLVFDGQLLKYEFSYDTRLNKEGKGRSVHYAKLKYTIKNKGSTELTFQEASNFKVLLSSNCPRDHINHLICGETIAVFNAETFEYRSHPMGLKLTNAFSKLSYPVDKE
ncbi:conserved protein, unknown function [Hepatocystis sp. ex Piliocolobus tephrosceles]|nr:conserved protein, unknown function [Hepatocystis sp. ex Piliocolobus tephrosceles]